MRKRLIRFGLVGMLNTAVGVGIIAGAIAIGVAPLVANALGFLTGLCVSFVANSRFTFGQDPRSLKRIIRYLAVFLIAYASNLVAVIALDLAFPAYETLTHVAGIVPYTVVFFILADRFVFRDSPPARGQAGDAGRADA